MSEKKGLIDKLSEMPKGKLIAISAVFFVIVGFLAVYFGFGFYQKPDEKEEFAPVHIDMQDPDSPEYNKSRLDTYKDADMEKRFTSTPSEDFWQNLGQDLVSDSAIEEKKEYLDPSIYSADEIRIIQSGLKTRAEIDQIHENIRKRNEELAMRSMGYSPAAGSGMEKPMTQAQRDSAYFARIERATQIAINASQQANPAFADDEEAPAEPEPEERKIELAPQSIPVESLSGDDIITSLVGDSSGDVVHYAGTRQSKPVKATFLKDEKLSDGQRVIIRLMQDLTLVDGTVIPENTHITGTCTFSKRLKIDVKTIHYGGRMFPCDISVYDNDGTEGIYCPTVDTDSKRKKNSAKKVAGEVLGAAGTVAGTLLTGNPFLGRVASSGVNTITSSIDTNGNISVKVTSGYEFYVFENVDLDKN